MYDIFLHSMFCNINDPDAQDMLAGDNVSVVGLMLTVGKCYRVVDGTRSFLVCGE
jgi:hypothetical protein